VAAAAFLAALAAVEALRRGLVFGEAPATPPKTKRRRKASTAAKAAKKAAAATAASRA